MVSIDINGVKPAKIIVDILDKADL